jgi:hypothetical protein
MFITLHWVDLSHSQQNNILCQLMIAFEKPYSKELINHLSKRFHHSFVDLFYLENKLIGVCIYWKETKYYYLDKFFVITKGYGKQMLKEWIETKGNKCYVWRTSDQLEKGFYGKHPQVKTFFKIDDYIYQGFGRMIWEEDDIRLIKSAFIL